MKDEMLALRSNPTMVLDDEELRKLDNFFLLPTWQQNIYLMVRYCGSYRAFGRKYNVSHTTVWKIIKEIELKINA